MIFLFYACAVLFLAALPVCMFLSNMHRFQTATRDRDELSRAMLERVSILIPARNESASIGRALDHLLENREMAFEILVLDDQSEDDTAAIVRDRMRRSTAIRLIESIELPDGWNGKQHACWRLAEHARFDWLLFLDADVRLSDQAVQRIVAEGLRTQAPLLSGFPHQETFTISEKMLIPLMHVILLGYLPIHQLRASTDSSLSAGCGQMMLARREAYFACGGHRAIRSSRHDGIQLPRAFRKHGLATDIFDANDIARCRMYSNRSEVVKGLLKNANEGIAHGWLIIVFSVLLAGAAILPVPSLLFAWWTEQSMSAMIVLAVASLCSFLPRMFSAWKFQQSWLGVVLHPLSIAWFLGLQWLAWYQTKCGKRVAWRGRT
jgi:glycosyltransferase involved in cell wall biosynthesis